MSQDNLYKIYMCLNEEQKESLSNKAIFNYIYNLNDSEIDLIISSKKKDKLLKYLFNEHICSLNNKCFFSFLKAIEKDNKGYEDKIFSVALELSKCSVDDYLFEKFMNTLSLVDKEKFECISGCARSKNYAIYEIIDSIKRSTSVNGYKGVSSLAESDELLSHQHFLYSIIALMQWVENKENIDASCVIASNKETLTLPDFDKYYDPALFNIIKQILETKEIDKSKLSLIKELFTNIDFLKNISLYQKGYDKMMEDNTRENSIKQIKVLTNPNLSQEYRNRYASERNVEMSSIKLNAAYNFILRIETEEDSYKEKIIFSPYLISLSDSDYIHYVNVLFPLSEEEIDTILNELKYNDVLEVLIKHDHMKQEIINLKLKRK
ncbi:MAG: hypothetical protein RSB41_02310 [Bacilli bacterium]